MSEQSGPTRTDQADQTQTGASAATEEIRASGGASAAPPRRLTRSNDDRMIAGVCGGIARHLGVDPTLVRLAAVVLAVLGGSGVVAYLLAWLVIPDDRSGEAVAGSFSTQSGNPAWVVGLVLVGLGLVAFVSPFGHHGDREGLVPLLLVAGGLALLWHQKSSGGTTTPPASGPGGTAPPPTGPAGAAANLPSPPPPAPPPEPPSVLAGVTLSLLLVAAGVAALLHTTGVMHVRGEVALAAALIAVGLALVVGTWWGRARGLIAVGVVLAIVLTVATVVDVPIRGGAGERFVRPLTPGELRPFYRHGMGELTLDLTEVEFPPGNTEVSVKLGAGEVLVLVPHDVDVVALGHVGAGELNLLGRRSNGLQVGAEARRSPAADPGADSTLVVRVEVGAGEAEVRRGAA